MKHLGNINDNTDIITKEYLETRVKTDVPTGAKFTDTNTVTSINGKTGVIAKADIVALGIPAQDTNTTYTAGTNITITGNTISATDTVVDVSGKADKTYVDDKVKTDVPTDAKFTDTIATKTSVGLDNVDNIKQATKVEFDEHLADDVIHGIYTDTVQTNIKYKLVVIDEEPFLEVVEV